MFIRIITYENNDDNNNSNSNNSNNNNNAHWLAVEGLARQVESTFVKGGASSVRQMVPPKLIQNGSPY